MEIWNALIGNAVLVNGVISWAVAQVLKTIIYAVMNRSLDFHRLFGDGGMPSGHSATVTAMALTTGYYYGYDTAIFAIATIFAIIVMHDAMGVRLETGKQAKVLNELIQFWNPDISNEEKLKEFVGHTPTQVVCGALLGVVMTVICCSYQ